MRQNQGGTQTRRGVGLSRPYPEPSPSPRPRTGVLLACLGGLCLLALCWIAYHQVERHEVAVLAGLALLTLTCAAGCWGRLRRKHESLLRQELARLKELAALHEAVVISLAMALDAKDQHTHGHLQRVQDVAVMIAEEMGVNHTQIEAVRMAALLHDIGKLAVPDHILSKPAKLTPEEMHKVQIHPVVGSAILEQVRFPWPVVPIVRSHHEWHDGRGYPDRLAREEIPIGARILALADAYDAMLSERPYRPAFSPQEAIARIREASGTQFDPRVVEACLSAIAKGRMKEHFGFIYDDAQEVDEAARPSAHVLERIAQADRELFALYEIVQTIGSSLNVSECLDLVMSKTKKIVNFSTCIIFLADPQRYDLVAAGVSGMLATRLLQGRLAVGQGISGQVALAGAPSGLNEEAQRDLQHLLGPAELSGCPLRHSLVVPLMADSETLGTLSLYHTAETQFSEDDLRLLTTVARQSAVAISNAHRFEQSEKHALTDGLTGLPNARYFFMHLEQELGRARREKETISLLALDVDNLKQINDSFGHLQADRVLRQLASIIKSQIREYDTAVRYAGDEFFIILPRTTNKQAAETARRIKQAVRTYDAGLRQDDLVAQVGVSIGLATFPGDAAELDELIEAADKAMYADKALNRQREALAGPARVAAGVG